VANQKNSATAESVSFRCFSKHFVAAVMVVLALASCGPLCRAQEMAQEPPRLAADRHTDARIAEAIRQVSADHIRQTIEKLVGFQNRSTISAQDEESIKAGKGIGAAREWIKAEFERYSKDCGGCLEVKTDSFTEQPAERIPKPTEITNVYAVLRGTGPRQADRVVLVTGHYDSRNSDNFNGTDPAPGANDDASGTAVSLECARVLSKAQIKFPATIIFLTVAGEEQGLYGSKHFAQMAKQNGWKIEAVLNNDIVGGNLGADQDAGVVRVFSEGLPAAATEAEIRRIRMLGGESDSLSRELARYIADVGRSYDAGVKPLLIFRLDRFLRGGDHYSFNQQGFAAVRFTEFREDYNHQHQNVRKDDANGVEYGDLPKFIDFDYVAHVTRLNAATLASLASAPAPPANVKMLTKNLDNDTTLTWEPSAGAAAYEVVWRSTNASDWEYVQTVGSGARATLKVSKDNVIFAVRAIDAAGHRSLPVVPEPER
jgi:Zn-dependent M28 family amino/carboxypeptidase